jgi:tRNA/tmRNA/rRNA uracil-C5-methylase (TrmA/RlmC/RlmD family)
MSNTDDAWEKFGKTDPYYGVLSHERIRLSKFAEDSRADFFLSGEEHVKLLFQTIREHVDPDFSPELALDFGCGVGRIAIPLARRVTKIMQPMFLKLCFPRPRRIAKSKTSPT